MTNRKAARTASGRRSRELRLAIGAEVRRLRLDAGPSQRRLAALAGIDHGFLSLIERGAREPSIAVLVAIADALGGSINVRLFPGTGPRLRDPIQARICEALIGVLDRRWLPLPEVPVYRPARGVIDLVLHDRSAQVVLAVEVHSQVPRLEQQLRWANEKADSLSSAEFWRFVDPSPTIDRLLVVRSTRTNRDIVARFAQTLGAAHPASPQSAFAALTRPDQPWPGSALLWATVNGDHASILDRPPRPLRAIPARSGGSVSAA